MSEEKAKLLGKILDAFFEAEFSPPQLKSTTLATLDGLLEEAAQMSDMSVGVIKEAILNDRYPQYRKERLKRELLSVPPQFRRQ